MKHKEGEEKRWLISIVTLLIVGLWVSFTLGGCSGNRETSDISSSEESEVTIKDADKAGNCTVCHTIGVHVQISGIAGQNPDDTTGYGTVITHDCEDCHGGGQYHHGEGPIPYPSPDGERCASCHDEATLVLASKHNGEDAENTSMLISSHNTSYCQRCHTAEGSIAFQEVIGEHDDIVDAIVAHGETPGAGQEEALADTDSDGNDILHNPACGACHNALTKEMVSFDTAVWDPNQNAKSDQFDLCTSCHNYQLNDGTIFGSGSAASGTAEFYHDTAWYRNITTTHYDDPLTGVGLAENKIEGYVVRLDSEDPCFDCHGHELFTDTRNADDPESLTIHTMWAKSGHGGHLLDTVFEEVALIDCTGSPSESRGRCDEQTDAAMAAGVTDATAAAWSHYNWDDSSSRASCQECHTATGAVAYLTDPASYNSANNDFSHLDSWSAAGGSPQNELLYCWGCHSDAESGELRNPGAVPRPYAVGGTDVVIDDVGKSNTCINCHGARGNVEEYDLDSVDDFSAIKPGFGPGTKNVTEAHYLVAAATIYAADTKIGYEYNSLDYAPKSYFAHDAISLNADSPETGDGPCVACHMQSTESHSFDVVEKDSSGVITGLKSTVCVDCHTGSHGAGLVVEDTTTENGLQTAVAAAEFLEEEAEGYHESLEILNESLNSVGLVFSTSYPYFSGTSWINEGVFGAAHNYNYLHHEPGAYAHNRYYTKRLIFDSIDWLEDYSIDGAATIDEVTYPEAAHWFGWDGMTVGFVASRP